MKEGHAHNWMSLYEIRTTKDPRAKKKRAQRFLVRCKNIAYAQKHLNNSAHYSKYTTAYTVNHFIMIIDKVEYTLDPENKESVKDVLKLHEAFYEKEYEEGMEYEAKLQKRLKLQSIILMGLSTSTKKQIRGDYVSYTRSINLEKIAIWIVAQQTNQWRSFDNKPTFSGMELHMPDKRVVNLPDFTIDRESIPHDKFRYSWFSHINEDNPRARWIKGKVLDWVKPEIERSIARSKEELEEAWIRVLSNPEKITLRS